MLTIGEFSRICFVTKKTLRHYDEIGLLRPEHIAENGYRYYTVAQLRSMLMISRLKAYGLSLPEIAAVLANPDEELLAARLAEKRRRMEQELLATGRILRQMEEDIDKLKRRMDIMEHNVIVKTAELSPMTLFGIRRTIDFKDFGMMFEELFGSLGKKRVQPLGPPMAFYHQEEFDRTSSDVEVAIQVADGTEGARRFSGGLHAFATLVGPYEDAAFTAAYAALTKWIEENGYRLCGAPFDKYVKGPENPPEEYITEIYFPIEK